MNHIVQYLTSCTLIPIKIFLSGNDIRTLSETADPAPPPCPVSCFQLADTDLHWSVTSQVRTNVWCTTSEKVITLTTAWLDRYLIKEKSK
jgi:hypothetical protein